MYVYWVANLLILYLFVLVLFQHFAVVDVIRLITSAGEPGAQKWRGDRGCPRKGDGSSSPLGRAPALRYPTFLSCCGGCSLPSGQGRGSSAAYPLPHAFLDLPPGGTQPPRLSLPVYLLHLPLLLFHHQCPAQPPLAWRSCASFNSLPSFLFPSFFTYLLTHCQLM